MKAKTRQQLANLYGVDRKTFSRWLEKRKLEIPEGLICPKGQERIFVEFGIPEGVDNSNGTGKEDDANNPKR